MSGQAAFDGPARPAALCRGVPAEIRKVGRNAETELNGVEEERDRMSDEEGDKIDDEEELGSARLASEGRTQEQTDTKGERRARSNTRVFPRLVGNTA